MNIKRRRLLALIAVAPTWLKQAFAETTTSLDEQNPIAAYGQSVVYGIYRKNKKIGEHTLHFTHTDTANSRLLVEIESKIVVTVLKVPVYRFNYRSTETWIGGQLQSVDAATNDNGKKHKVSAERIADDMEHMLLEDKNGNTTKAKVGFASNHWNSRVVSADKMFNTLTGKANEIVFQANGVVNIRLADNSKSTIEATHYKITGQVNTDIWYDTSGRWVQLRFKGKDGTAIEYRCQGFNL